jgi:NAD(P)-dependent dehydrogenase (short-subunit alcohol dehydrogenase family)
MTRAEYSKLSGPIARGALKMGLTPDSVTIIGTAGTVLAALTLYPAGHLFIGWLVIWFFVLADMLDGAMARERGGGKVVNFYSIDVDIGAWLHADYNTAKAGIVGLTRSAAVEWGRFNIRVNAIAPTGMGQVFAQLVKDVPGFLDMATSTNPLKRAGDPEKDIGPVVVFLASEMSRFITGEMINVDGGQNLPGYVSIPHNLDEMEKGSE